MQSDLAFDKWTMAALKKWRKRQAYFRALAQSSSDDDGADEPSLQFKHEAEKVQSSEEEVAFSPADDSFSDYWLSDCVVSSDSESGDTNVHAEPDSENKPDLAEEIASWATRNKCTRAALNELLDIFRGQGHRLPKDARTLLQTPQKVETLEKCGGQYRYFGIASGLLKILAQNPDFQDDCIQMCINIDGVPLFKSSGTQLWPILCSFHCFQPFIVGIYCGRAKPDSVDEYLADFLAELQQLTRDGIKSSGKTIRLVIKAFICDAPARAFLKCTKSHNSYYACERCTIRGYYERRVVLGAEEAGICLRSEEEFNQVLYTHHQSRKSPLITAGIPCIQSFALDYMHLVCLGVVRRMLHYIRNGPPVCKASSQQRKMISDNLASLSGKMPCEFARQPRTLLELDRWKATELRQFLLYTGPVVLKGVVSGDLYNHFLTLTVAMSILLNSDDQKRNEYLPYASELLVYFVKKCREIYGNTFAVYNVHSLVHLPADVQNFQCSLNDVSAFPFENYLQTLKRLVKQSRNPIVQVTKRLTELERCSSVQPTCMSTKNYRRISATLKDGCFLLDSNDFAFVKEKRHDGTLVCDVIRHRHTENLFESPCASKLLNIARVRQIDRLHGLKRKLILTTELRRKVVCLPMNEGYALFPMLHDIERL